MSKFLFCNDTVMFGILQIGKMSRDIHHHLLENQSDVAYC